VPLSTFDIAQETSQLIYGQTVSWLGLFFSPLLPLVFVLLLVVMFYLKQVPAQWSQNINFVKQILKQVPVQWS
jgi:hypothetical protein